MGAEKGYLYSKGSRQNLPSLDTSQEVRFEQPLKGPVDISREKTWKRHPMLRGNICENTAIKKTNLSRNHT